MGQSRRDEASSPHGHAALSPARQCMQGASLAPYVLQFFLRFHLGDSLHLAPAPLAISSLFVSSSSSQCVIASFSFPIASWCIMWLLSLGSISPPRRSDKTGCYAPGTGMKHLGSPHCLQNFLLWLTSCLARRCGIRQRGCG